MSPYKRNIAVGLTVLVSLVLLAVMILRFSDAPFRLMQPAQIMIHFRASGAEGVGDGSPVLYKGVNVGRVIAIRRSDDQLSVVINAMVDNTPPLPANVRGVIRSQLLGGGSSINLELIPPTISKPSTSATTRQAATPAGALTAGSWIDAVYVGVDLIPPEIVALASDLTETSKELRRIGEHFRETNVIEKLAATIDKTGKTVESIDSLVNDKKMRQDLQQAVANFNEASRSAKQIGQDLQKLSANADKRLDELAGNGNKLLGTAQQRIDDIGKQLLTSLAKVDKSLESFEAASRKLNNGDGSAARLINDPALYETLLETSKELKFTIKTFHRLAEQWEEEGVPFKLR